MKIDEFYQILLFLIEYTWEFEGVDFTKIHPFSDFFITKCLSFIEVLFFAAKEECNAYCKKWSLFIKFNEK